MPRKQRPTDNEKNDHPSRIAVLGGDGRFDKRSMPHSKVRIYEGRRSGGNGPLRRLEAALKAGGVDQVIILVRWVGHSAFNRILALCRKLGVPFEIRR